MRPVGQAIITVNKQADQRRAHPAIILNGLLFAENGAIRGLHIITDMLRVKVFVAIEAGNNTVAGQFSGHLTARQASDAVTDDKAG